MSPGASWRKKSGTSMRQAVAVQEGTRLKTKAAECGIRETEAERLLHGVTRARGGHWPAAQTLWAGQGKWGQ